MIDLSPWPGLAVVRELGGGRRNVVYEVSGRGRLVARRSSRAADALDWELDLLEFLAGHGFTVPATVPSADGRRSVGGLVVQTWVEGLPPHGDDWQLVARELTRLHGLTAGWPQRPGFASARDLLVRERGGDVDLTSMPADAIATCRTAWAALRGVPRAVVHGDPGAANIRMLDGRVGLIDWDEARVDHGDLDLVEIRDGPLAGGRAQVAAAAMDAWEAANGCAAEPAYARARLARLRRRTCP